MLVVSGASGHLGRRTVELLLERVDAARVVALTRTPERLSDLGVTVRRADFDNPDGLVAAFEDAERLLIISTDRLGPGGHRIRQHTNAVQAAVKAGVGQLFYTSIVRADDLANPAVVAPDHRETERVLLDAGVTYTVLRNNIYLEILLMSLAPAVAAGVLASNAADGATGYVAREDCAAVAAALLAGGGHEGELVEVTGPAAVTGAEVADILTDVVGRPVRFEPLTDEQVVAGMTDQGVPLEAAQAASTFGRAAREGFLDVVSDAVQRIAGRAPTSVAQFLADHREMLLA